MSSFKDKSVAWLKGAWITIRPYIDLASWLLFPPYGLYIGYRHVKENWSYYRTMAETAALMWADKLGYSDEEQEAMLVRIHAHRERKEAKREAKKLLQGEKKT